MNVNYLDIGLLIFLLGFGAVGFIVGFTEKVFSIISWVGAALLSYYTYDWVRPWVYKWIEKPSIATLVTSLGLFIIYLALFSLLSKGLHDRIQKSMFKKADRYLGVLLGIATGYVVLILATLICRTIVPSNQYPEWSKDSIIWSSAEKGGNFMEGFLPLRKPTTDFFYAAEPKSIAAHAAPIKKTKSVSKKAAHPKNSPPKKRSYSAEDRQGLNSLVQEYT
jgi:membrane protein required for colicin V production